MNIPDIMRPCMVCGQDTDNPDNVCMKCQEEFDIWSIHRYQVYCDQLRKDLKNDDCYNDEVVWDVAKNILESNRELKEFIKNELRAQDVIGRFVNDI